MIRAHKIRLNPTTEQELYFRKAAGTKRFVYNWALDRWKWAKSQSVATYGMMAAKKDFNGLKGEQFPWVYEVAKDVAEGAFQDVGAAIKNYKVGRFFASSKTCSDCGYINGQLTLADRKWACVRCGVIASTRLERCHQHRARSVACLEAGTLWVRRLKSEFLRNTRCSVTRYWLGRV